jgi:oligosaccharyltransferase complex subunit beta
MLDPYIRVNLPHVRSDKTSAWYEKTIQLPDVFGVYTFRVRYQRPGYSWIHYAEQVPIRPFRHDEYPRFLTIAYPYYTGAGSVMIAFVVFVVVWLYHHDVHNK